MVFLVGYVLISFDSSRSLIFESDSTTKKRKYYYLGRIRAYGKNFLHLINE